MKSSERCAPEHLRYCVLQTDSVLEQFQPQHGDYSSMFEDLLRDGGVDESCITVVDVRERLPRLEDHEVYLITGSRLSVYDDEPWIPRLAEFVGAAMADRRPVIGICFGHQLLAHFFGGRVEPASVGWAVGVQHNEVVQPVSWMQPALERFDLISSHKDQVRVLPPDATLLARTPICEYAAFTLGDYGLAIQGHPEFVPEYAADLLAHRRELLGEPVYQTAKASLTCPLHRTEMVAWMLGFARERAAA